MRGGAGIYACGWNLKLTGFSRCGRCGPACFSASAVSALARGKRQQSDVARPLDGRGKATLVRRAHSGQPPGDDLAPLGDKLPKQANILVIDIVNLLDAEFTDLLAAEKFAPAIPA